MKRSTASTKRWIVPISYFIFCLFSITLFAQKQVTVHANGTSVSSDLTPKQALEEADGVVAHAAKKLKMRRTTLVEKIRRHQLTPQQKAG